MKLTKENLINKFNLAKQNDAGFVFVGIGAEGVEEVICIPRHSFDEKLEFYKRSYTDELVHVMNKNVLITKVSIGDSGELDKFYK